MIDCGELVLRMTPNANMRHTFLNFMSTELRQFRNKCKQGKLVEAVTEDLNLYTFGSIYTRVHGYTDFQLGRVNMHLVYALGRYKESYLSSEMSQNLVKFSFWILLFLYTGWPRKNATLTINNFKKTRDRMKKLCTLLSIKLFFQQDDTKIVNFDEGVLILEPFF